MEENLTNLLFCKLEENNGTVNFVFISCYLNFRCGIGIDGELPCYSALCLADSGCYSPICQSKQLVVTSLLLQAAQVTTSNTSVVNHYSKNNQGFGAVLF